MTLRDQMPFGKFKGLPIGELSADYKRWLLQQDWFVDPKGRWKELHDLLTKGESKTASEEELTQNKLEDEVLARADPDFKPWWEKAYGRRLREAKSPHYITYLRLCLETWIAARSSLLTPSEEEQVSPESPDEEYYPDPGRY